MFSLTMDNLTLERAVRSLEFMVAIFLEDIYSTANLRPLCIKKHSIKSLFILVNPWNCLPKNLTKIENPWKLSHMILNDSTVH